ncbi:MAG: hypothetical protein II695_06605 [Oscillospiraceae bacterium]|nr:hypothetical protein [Oscillospiraceae bacterium]
MKKAVHHRRDTGKSGSCTALNIAGIVEKLWWAQLCICAAMLIQIRLRREEKR